MMTPDERQETERLLVSTLLQHPEALAMVLPLHEKASGSEWCEDPVARRLLSVLVHFGKTVGFRESPSRDWLVRALRADLQAIHRGRNGSGPEVVQSELEALEIALDRFRNRPVPMSEGRHWAQLLAEENRHRKLFTMLGQAALLAESQRPEETLSYVLQQAMELAHCLDDDPVTLSSLGNEQELLADADELHRMHHNPEYFKGWLTGITRVDNETNGLQPSEMGAIVSRTGGGKAQPVETPVLTPGGWCPIGDLLPGDLVIGKNGKSIRVLAIHPQGEKQVWRVITSDGGTTECCDEHLWTTWTRSERAHKKQAQTRKLAEIRATLRAVDNGLKSASDGKHNHILPIVEPVHFQPVAKLPLDPYLLGLLLGDGHFPRGAGNIGFCNPEPDLAATIREKLPDGDMLIQATGRTDTFWIRGQKGTRGHMAETRLRLLAMQLVPSRAETKFIPLCYMRASIENRLALLQGLMDTDGSLRRRGPTVEYSTVSSQLAEQVTELARSLGGITHCVLRQTYFTSRGQKKAGQPSYRITLTLPPQFCPVRSQKHRAKWNPPPARRCRTIDRVEKVGPKECVCITVDAPDGLYVTSDYIVTHNSHIIRELLVHAAAQGARVLLVSAEMRAKLVRRQLYSRLTGWPYHDLKFGLLTDQQREEEFFPRLRQAIAALPGEITILDLPQNASVGLVSTIVRERQLGDFDFYAWDHMGLFRPSITGKNTSREEADWLAQMQVSNEIREFSTSTKNAQGGWGVVSWVALQERPRAGERAIEKLQSTDINRSSGIAQGMTVVIHLIRDTIMGVNNQALLKVTKVRDGNDNLLIRVRTDLPHMRFFASQEDALYDFEESGGTGEGPDPLGGF